MAAQTQCLRSRFQMLHGDAHVDHLQVGRGNLLAVARRADQIEVQVITLLPPQPEWFFSSIVINNIFTECYVQRLALGAAYTAIHFELATAFAITSQSLEVSLKIFLPVFLNSGSAFSRFL
jgi:hypothetical protein